MSNQTPQTQKEFIDYRFNETIKTIEDVKKDVKDISDKLDNSFATKDYVDGKVKNHEDRLSSLENDRLWAVRLVLGIIITAVIYAVVRHGG